MNEIQAAIGDLQPALFPDPPCEVADQAAAKPTSDSRPATDARSATPRLRLPQREQGQMFLESHEQRVEADHVVRTVWAFVEQVDLSPLLNDIKAVEGVQGRDANDPRILLALWLYAVIEGVGSARQLDRLCRDHRAYQWICGEVSVNYHTLADFRVEHGTLLDQILAQSLASLTREGLVDINTVAQDGMRIRASAGASSFRREATLKEHLKDAVDHLQTLKTEIEVNPGKLDAARKAAQLRAAREKAERLEKAIENVREIAASREARKPGDGAQARASSTDPEARRMKMPDGGTRPAYNAQFATATGSGIIVGVQTSNAGVDANEFEPMLDHIENHCGQRPETALLDGGYNTKDNIDLAHERKIILLAPLKAEQKQLDAGKDPYAPKRGDSDAVKAYRARMATDEAKTHYKLRGQTAEWVNAQARNSGLYMLEVRGKEKVQAVLLMFALAHNLLTVQRLRAERAERAKSPSQPQANPEASKERTK